MRKGILIFFTATVLNWKHLFRMDKYKNMILNSLQFLVENQKIKLYGFVIMPNHIHLLWQVLESVPETEHIQHSLLSFTAHQFQKDLQKHHPAVLERFEVNEADRKYQFWERNPRATEIYSREVAEQKLHYIHHNPLQEKWNLAASPEEYSYSSAAFYESGESQFEFLSHYMEYFNG